VTESRELLAKAKRRVAGVPAVVQPAPAQHDLVVALVEIRNAEAAEAGLDDRLPAEDRLALVELTEDLALGLDGQEVGQP